MSIKDLQIYMMRAKGAYFSRFKVPPIDMQVIENNDEHIKIRALGKDKFDKEVDVTITIRKKAQ